MNLLKAFQEFLIAMSTKPFILIDFEPEIAPKYVKQGYSIVAVDVLRATSTIIVALAQGAKEVIPSASVEETKDYKKFCNALTVGERQGEKLPDFDFTNSPYDLSKKNLHNQVIAITSTTGTPLIAKSVGAENILIGSTINAYSVAKRMQELSGKWAVIGAGNPEEFLEDQVGCAMIAKKYTQLTPCSTDSKSLKIIDTYATNIKKHILNSPGTSRLLQIGRKKDIDFVIAATNKYNIVPFVKKKKYGNKIRLSISKI
jgi:2-phosphosulfolactate phosphatase